VEFEVLGFVPELSDAGADVVEDEDFPAVPAGFVVGSDGVAVVVAVDEEGWGLGGVAIGTDVNKTSAFRALGGTAGHFFVDAPPCRTHCQADAVGVVVAGTMVMLDLTLRL
jgi:hypothetical protein